MKFFWPIHIPLAWDCGVFQHPVKESPAKYLAVPYFATSPANGTMIQNLSALTFWASIFQVRQAAKLLTI